MAIDGIKIKISADAKSAEKQFAELEKRFERLRKAEEKDRNISKQYQEVSEAAKKAYAEAEAALEKYKAAEDKAARRGQLVEQWTRQQNPNATQADIDKAASKDRNLFRLSAEAEEAREKYLDLAEAAQTLSGKKEQLEKAAQESGAAIKSEREAVTEMQEEINNTLYVVDNLAEKFRQIGEAVKAGVKQGVDGAAKSIRELPQAAKAIGKDIASGITKGMRGAAQIFSSLGKAIRKAAQNMGIFRRESKRADKTAAGFAKTILKLGNMLKLMLARRLLSAMISGAREGLQNLARYSNDTNANLSALKSSLTTLKNSFATAFNPISSVVTPALVQLINLLSQAITYVGMLFSALSGASVFTKAAKVTEDYAESLGAAGTAADDNKQKFGFDNLNQLSGSAAGGGGAGGAAVTDMFEETAIPSWILELRDLILGEDWDALGEYIAHGINNGLQRLERIISWDNLGEPIVRAVNGITGTINSLVNSIDWAQMGRTMGTGVNTLVNTLYLLFTGINWFNIGAALATSLNSMIETIDWYHLGETIGAYFSIALFTLLGFVQTFDFGKAGVALGTALQGIVDYIDWDALGSLIAGSWNGALLFLYNAVTTFDWIGTASRLASGLNTLVQEIDWAATGQTLGTLFISVLSFLTTAVAEFDWVALRRGIETALVNIDWAGIAAAVASAFGVAVGVFFALIKETIASAWNPLVDWWHNVAFEDGEFTIEGLLLGIIDALVGIGTWIKDNIFKPFIDGFKKAFGIHSPSTVMAEMGGFILDGLFNGLVGLWDKVGSIFTGAIDNIRNIFSLDTLRNIGSNAVTGFMNGLKSIGNSVKEWGSGILGNMKDALGIHSPSTETKEVGEYTVDGYIIGLETSQSRLEAVLQAISEVVVAAFKRTADAVLETQDEAEKKSTDKADAWMGTTKRAFSAFYTDMSRMADNWARDLQRTLDSMVSAARSAASSISSSLSSAQSGSSKLSSMSTASTAGSPARVLAANLPQPGATIRVPAYATGKILPANNPHLAIVGDQHKGTNIETQMSTMVAAFKQAVSEMGGGTSNRPLQLNLYLDTGARLGRALIPSIEEAEKSRGISLTARG